MQPLKVGLQLLGAAVILMVAGVVGTALGGSHAPQPAAAAQIQKPGAPRNAPPVPQTTRAPYSTRTAADVAANLPIDPWWVRLKSQAATPGAVYDPRVALGTLGQPVFVQALQTGRGDGWLVPVFSPTGAPVAVVVVSRDVNGMGVGTAMRGWSYPTFPAVPEAVARANAAASGDPAVSAALMWSDGFGRPSDLLSPFWRVTLASGAHVFVFEDGLAAPATRFGFK